MAMALRLEAAFGLRREEAIKFAPARDDRGDRIRLKGSTTKGGRPREVPVRNEAQRRLLDEACGLAGAGGGRAAATFADGGAATDRREARRTIAEELGHGRTAVSSTYLGS